LTGMARRSSKKRAGDRSRLNVRAMVAAG
jgi:hypothetical protein